MEHDDLPFKKLIDTGIDSEIPELILWDAIEME
jgi:hypothetical protein